MAITTKIVRGDRSAGRKRRHDRVRKRISGTSERPRLVVFRSSRHMVAQVVDDSAGTVIAAASTMEPELRGSSEDKKAKAGKVGELVAARAQDAGVTTVVFDRGGYRYHGRVAAVADAARDAGLKL